MADDVGMEDRDGGAESEGADSKPGRRAARRIAEPAKQAIASFRRNAAAIMDWTANLADSASLVFAALGIFDLYMLMRLVALPLRAGSLIIRVYATKARGDHQPRELVLEAVALGLGLASLTLLGSLPTVSIILKIMAFVLHMAIAWWLSRK
jgi:hypothetical protein